MPTISQSNKKAKVERPAPLEDHVERMVASYQELDQRSPDLLTLLTPRQLVQLIVLAQVPIKESVSILGIKENSVKRSVGDISKKVGTYHRGQWMKLAIKQGLITV